MSINFFNDYSTQKLIISKGNQDVECIFDSNSGVEIERGYYLRDGNTGKRNGLGNIYKRNEEHFGLVEKFWADGEKQNGLIDLTKNNKNDIGTFGDVMFGMYNKPDGQETSYESFEADYNEYKKRLEERIKISANPDACRKYAGILETQKEKYN